VSARVTYRFDVMLQNLHRAGRIFHTHTEDGNARPILTSAGPRYERQITKAPNAQTLKPKTP
jgi:hypothetical protein